MWKPEKECLLCEPETPGLRPGHLRTGHTGHDNENKTGNAKNARPRLVELAWAYSAWSNLTNRGWHFYRSRFRSVCPGL